MRFFVFDKRVFFKAFMFKITDEGEIIGELLDFFIYMNDKFWIL